MPLTSNKTAIKISICLTDGDRQLVSLLVFKLISQSFPVLIRVSIFRYVFNFSTLFLNFQTSSILTFRLIIIKKIPFQTWAEIHEVLLN